MKETEILKGMLLAIRNSSLVPNDQVGLVIFACNTDKALLMDTLIFSPRALDTCKHYFEPHLNSHGLFSSHLTDHPGQDCLKGNIHRCVVKANKAQSREEEERAQDPGERYNSQNLCR